MASEVKIETRGRKRDDQLIARRKEEILHSASRAFANFGYANTDVERIASTLDISKGTIYRYFPSKEKLFLAALDREVHRLREQVMAAYVKGDDALLQFARALNAFMSFFHENPHAIELLMHERAKFSDRESPTYLAQRASDASLWRSLMEKLIAKGYFRHMDIDMMLDTLANLIYGAIFLNKFHENRSNLTAQAIDILSVLMNGFGTNEARTDLALSETDLADLMK
ncbi:MAG: TetR/AcrR family transcriptional regulator [Candidatus Hydrogenedentota bacterium]